MHKLLARQIAKATNEAGSVDLEKLFALIADAYADVDRDRRRTDRSMSLMIEEIDTVQRNLQRTVIERTKELREREAELQAQNMRFAAAISHMSQGLVMFDSQTRLVICNQRFLAMYGLEADGIRALRALGRVVLGTEQRQQDERQRGMARIGRNQLRPGKGKIEIGGDSLGFVNFEIAVTQHRHFAEGMNGTYLWRAE